MIGTLTMTEINLNTAQKIISFALEKGRSMKLKPLSLVVLDSGGHVKAFAREDGASPGRFAIAHGKAFGTIMLGMAGTAQMARADEQAYFMTAVNGLFGGQVVPVPGGIAVLGEAGQIIGAVGVTGDTSDNDAVAGLAGIEAAGYTGEI